MFRSASSGLRRFTNRCAAASLSFAALVLVASSVASAQDDAERTGAQIYQSMCAECHGVNGEGVADQYSEPLAGTRSLQDLREIIHDTMPEEDPDLCTGEQAESVARYIFETFYSEEARARYQPARIELAHLTVRQFQNTVADLVGSFVGSARIDQERGLKAQYYNDRNFRRDKRVKERIDAQVSFDFGEGPPDAGEIDKDTFAIQWQGSLLADETGDYEILLRTENGIRLYINDTKTPLIDGWVRSGDMTDHRATIRLLGGRAYPLRLDFLKFKDKSASVSLEWQPPHRVREIVPERNLTPSWNPPTLVVETELPADDSSIGYERGTFVSKSWDQATTYAAVEVANKVAAQLNELAKVKDDAGDRAEKVRAFCGQLTERIWPAVVARTEVLLCRPFLRCRRPIGRSGEKVGHSDAEVTSLPVCGN